MINISDLKKNDIIRNIGSGTAYTVTGVTDSGKIYAVRELEVTNPTEWELVWREQVIAHDQKDGDKN